MTIIIYEGADGVGKTTAVNKTAAILRNTAILHRGPPTHTALIEYTEEMQKWLDRGVTNIVCDRWHWGEMIYGPLFRKKCILTDVSRAAIDEFLWEHGAVIIFIDDQVAAIKKRLEDRGDDQHVLEHLDHITYEYRNLYESSSFPRAMRVTGPPTDKDIDDIISFARRVYATRH